MDDKGIPKFGVHCAKIRNGFYAVLLSVSLLACSSISPHENFLQGLHSKIGQNIDSLSPYWTHQEDLIDTTRLPNGDVEYRYKYFGTCRYIFEVNPSTHIIVGARFEGKDSDCVINP
jgi:hypothetical protein